MDEDRVMPEGKWTFDGDVAACFDNMLERSIPQYPVMRRAVFDVACKYRRQGGMIVDLGCSRGEAMAPLIELYRGQNQYVGIEVSEAMLAAVRERFARMIEDGYVQILDLDLRRKYPERQANITLAILTIQFTPIEYRQQILRRIWEHTEPGGVLVMVEKIMGGTASIDTALVELYLSSKEQNGYTQDQIERKRLSLEGVLVPVTARWNEELLRTAGFNQVDCFWRWMNFAGWLAIKD